MWFVVQLDNIMYFELVKQIDGSLYSILRSRVYRKLEEDIDLLNGIDYE